MSLDFLMEFIADNVPAILILGAILFVFLGLAYEPERNRLFSFAFLFFVAGVFLQYLWLKSKRR